MLAGSCIQGKYQNGMPLEVARILGRSGTQYVAMVAKQLSSY